MNDDELTDGLRGLATGVRPPADAVERIQRGVRVRRRRRGAVAAAAAVLVVAGGGTAGAQWLAGGPEGQPTPADRPSATTPSPAPTVAWEQRIPAGFRLDDGLSEPDGVESSRSTSRRLSTPWALDPCREGSVARGRSDFLQLTQQGLEQLSGRQLAVYSDAAAAQAVVDGFRDALSRCPNPPLDGGASLSYTAAEPDSLTGDDGFTVTAQYSQDGLATTGATEYVVIRVGNAVLVTEYSGEFGASTPDHLAAVVSEQHELAVSIADRMCVFAEAPCER